VRPRWDEPIDIFDRHLYEKGGRVLHMLRTELGDDAFFAAIQHYLTKHRFGVVETRDLARAVEESSGRGLDWFFDQWVTGGAGHPELAITCAWDVDRGRLVVGVKQTQPVDARTPCFRLPLIVRVRDAAGAERDVRFEVREAQHSFQLELPSAPVQVVIDPGRVLLAELTIEKPQPLWLAELAGATLAADRVAAARALGRIGGPRADAALRAALEGDPHWTVRAAAARALAGQRSSAGKSTLLAAATTDASPKARRAITAALGDYLGDDEVAAALARQLERGDASYFVEAAAAHALGRTRSPRAAAALRQAARRDSFQDVIRAGAYRGLAEARDESAATLLHDGTRWGELPQGRRAAIMALAQLMRGRRDLAARDARETIEALLRDRDFRVQAAAIEGLAVIGDPASIEALRLLIARELDGRLRRRAREVVRDLAEGAPVAEELRRLRDELDAVRALATGLRERLERLEPGAAIADDGGGKKSSKKAGKKAPKKKPKR
jgi:aminopeptidase N